VLPRIYLGKECFNFQAHFELGLRFEKGLEVASRCGIFAARKVRKPHGIKRIGIGGSLFERDHALLDGITAVTKLSKNMAKRNARTKVLGRELQACAVGVACGLDFANLVKPLTEEEKSVRVLVVLRKNIAQTLECVAEAFLVEQIDGVFDSVPMFGIQAFGIHAHHKLE